MKEAINKINKYRQRIFRGFVFLVSLDILFFLGALIFFGINLALDSAYFIYSLLSIISIALFFVCSAITYCVFEVSNHFLIEFIYSLILKDDYKAPVVNNKRSIELETILRSDIYLDATSVKGSEYIASSYLDISFYSSKFELEHSNSKRKIYGDFFNFILPFKFDNDVVIFPSKSKDYIDFVLAEKMKEIEGIKKLEDYTVFSYENFKLDKRILPLLELIKEEAKDNIFILSIKGNELFLSIERTRNYNVKFYSLFLLSEYEKMSHDFSLFKRIIDCLKSN